MCCSDQPAPKFESVLSFFVMQSFSDAEIPINFRSKFIFGLLLILGLLYGSLFSSEIVSKMIYPKYERLILSMEDLANSNLQIRIDYDHKYAKIPPKQMTVYT